MTGKSTKPAPKKLPNIRRRQVDSSPESLVSVEPMFPDRAIPMVVRPAIDGVDLNGWAQDNKARVRQLVDRHGAVLFRGFGITDVRDFERFVSLTSDGPALDYKDRSTPRETRGAKVYTSTVYPADQTIRPHNEGTYWLTWAMKLYFCCRVAARRGGETPIADVRRVHDRLAPELRRRFAEKGMVLVRNYNDGFGLSWQEVFQTADRAEVEHYCRQNNIEFEWKEGDRLRTRQVRPAIRRHPENGANVWFNHAAFFHVTALDPDLRKALLDDFGEAGLPYNTYYGDGTPIEPVDIAEIQRAYAAETVMFPWQDGDVMILDNMSVAHARQPYEGEREVVVMMTEPYTGVETVPASAAAS
jgi:alpha-ketoglutarate-dependent taurine dioxygenase